MQQATEAEAGSIEIVVCRYAAQLGAPINPAPPRYDNDTSSTPWGIGECKWSGGCVVVTWVRRTLSPLQPQAMIDLVPPLPPPPPGALPAAYVDNVGPAPVAAADGAAVEAAPSARLQHPAISAGPPVPLVGQVPNLAPGHIAPLPHYYHLPEYARPRGAVPMQRNVTERSAVSHATTPITAPGYQPPPIHQPVPGVAVGEAGLLASAEVRPFGGPLPPSPLDVAPPNPPQESSVYTMIGAVPPVSNSVTPSRPLEPAPRNVPQSANVAVSSRGATDPHGHTATVQTEPARLSAPPVYPSNVPIDRSLHPRAAVPPPPETVQPEELPASPLE